MAVRNRVIDLYKGIAIIMVILVHSTQRFANLSNVFQIFNVGQFGCQIFFVLSGYLSMKSCEQDKNRFYRKKFCAIAPGYYLLILITVILDALVRLVTNGEHDLGKNTSGIAILCNVLFLNGILPFCNNNVVGGGWYIGTISIMYFFTPYIYNFLQIINKKHFVPVLWFVFSGILAGILSVCLHKHVFHNNGFYYFSFIEQMPCFLLGCVLYSERDHIKQKNILGGGYFDGAIGFMFVVGSILCFLFAHISFLEFLYLLVPVTFAYGFYFFIRRAILKPEEFPKNNILTIIEYFGKNSFFIFLVHTFFVWHMPELVLFLLSKEGVILNITGVYLLMLPFMFVFSLFSSIIYRNLCNKITRWLIIKFVRENS